MQVAVYKRARLQLLIILQPFPTNEVKKTQPTPSNITERHSKTSNGMKFFMVFSALLVLAVALPSNYVMKQEKELLKDVLQYLENFQTEGIIIVQCHNNNNYCTKLNSVWPFIL